MQRCARQNTAASENLPSAERDSAMGNRRNFLQRALGIGVGLIAAPALAESAAVVGAPAGAGSGNAGPASLSAAGIKQGAYAGIGCRGPAV